MSRHLLTATLPLILIALLGAPAQAQIRVELGNVQIRFAPEPPPQPRFEVQLVRPSHEHVWIPGYWERGEDRWLWCGGRWERPVTRGDRWIAARSCRDAQGYRWEPGHWASQRLVEPDHRGWVRDHGRPWFSQGREERREVRQEVRREEHRQERDRDRFEHRRW